MGCGGSTEAEPVEATEQAEEYEKPATDIGDLKFDLERAEAKAVEAGPEKHTFLASVLKARQGHDEDADIMQECCVKLQAHNRKLKSLIATADAEAVNEAMNGGFLGWGCNDQKLIAVLCSRTKAQLATTAKRYRSMYDKDMGEEVAGETFGNYGKMMSFAMTTSAQYVAKMIDVACGGWGCDEGLLVELFVMCEQAQLKEGKSQWEGKNDKSLIDYLNKELGSSYRNLAKLLLLLLKGDLNNEEVEVDDERIKQQVEDIRGEVSKSGWGGISDESTEVIIDIVGANNTAQNVRLAELYENTYNESLKKSIKDKCGNKVGACLYSLLLPRPDYLAMRIEQALSAWFTDKSALIRLLGGLDGRKMIGVLDAYERKYGLPLASKLTNEIDGKFAKAALTWIRSLDDPAGGVEGITETNVEDWAGDAPKLSGMCDLLLLENEMLMRFAASLDMETITEAIKGWGTDDTQLIRVLTTRSKRFLGRISYMYRETYGETLSGLVDDNCGTGWYAYLAKFLVLQASQSDALLLDLALEDTESTDKNALIEFLCARHPRRVRAAKKAWEKRNDESLVDRLSDRLGDGDLKTIALTMLKGKRNTEEVDEEAGDMAMAKDQAKALNDDMSEAINILCSNSPAQNSMIARAYEETFDMSLGRALGEEFSGTVKAALSALLLEPAYWYAARLKASFANAGGSDRTVCRIVGAHGKDEIRQIAAAYDDKYGRTLTSDIKANCKGNYKRLAVAWVDLPDQLEQPQKLIELPDKPSDEAEEEPVEDVAVVEDDHLDEEDEEDINDLPDPSSTLYKAKVMLWTKKLTAAEEAGKSRKTAYYRRLLTMYPPVPSGHDILREYIEVLTAEYKNGEEGMVTIWIEATNKEKFEEAGTTKDIFDEWQNTSEKLVKEKQISIGELKYAWGVNKKKETLPEAPEEEEEPEEVPEEPKPAAAPPPPMGAPPSPMMQMGMQQMQMQQNMMMMHKQPSSAQMMVNQFGQFGQRQAMGMAMQTVQTTMQHTIMQPPMQTMGVRKMAATVPWGIYGGMQMQVDTPHGRMKVTVPPGYGPGSSFTFNVPVRM